MVKLGHHVAWTVSKRAVGIQLKCRLVTNGKRSCLKVMFPVVSVRYSVHGGCGVGEGVPTAIEAEEGIVSKRAVRVLLEYFLARIVFTFSLNKSLT